MKYIHLQNMIELYIKWCIYEANVWIIGDWKNYIKIYILASLYRENTKSLHNSKRRNVSWIFSLFFVVVFIIIVDVDLNEILEYEA